MKTSRSLPILALALAGGLLFTGCAATGATSEPAASSTPAAKPLTPIQLVQKADPDNIGDGLMYTKISKNKLGQYVQLGVDKNSNLGKFAPKIWTKTGKSWTEKDMAAAQLAAVNYVYGDLLSGPAAGGSDQDAAAQAKSLAKQYSKSDQHEAAKVIPDLYKGPVNENVLLMWADPKLNNFTGYSFYQSKDASRFLNPTVKLKSANSYSAGDLVDSEKAAIDGATVTVVANFDWKMTKDGKTFRKPTEIIYDVYLRKEDGKVSFRGAALDGEPAKGKPKEAKF